METKHSKLITDISFYPIKTYVSFNCKALCNLNFVHDYIEQIYIPSEKEDLDKDTIILNNSEESTSTDIQSNQLSSEESKSSVSCLFPERLIPKESTSVMDTSKKSLYKKRGSAKKLKISATEKPWI